MHQKNVLLLWSKTTGSGLIEFRIDSESNFFVTLLQQMFMILQRLKILLIIFLIFICIQIKLVATKDLKQTSKKIRI